MKTLSKFMNVDIFGKCGALNCRKSRLESCYREMNRTYKFYLSFENSLCQVYLKLKFLKPKPNLSFFLSNLMICSGLCHREVFQHFTVQCDSCGVQRSQHVHIRSSQQLHRRWRLLVPGEAGRVSQYSGRE